MNGDVVPAENFCEFLGELHAEGGEVCKMNDAGMHTVHICVKGQWVQKTQPTIELCEPSVQVTRLPTPAHKHDCCDYDGKTYCNKERICMPNKNGERTWHRCEGGEWIDSGESCVAGKIVDGKIHICSKGEVWVETDTGAEQLRKRKGDSGADQATPQS